MAEDKVKETPKEFLTLYAAVEMLGLSRKTIYNLMKTDETFPAPFALNVKGGVRGRKNYRFEREELVKWVKNRRVM